VLGKYSFKRDIQYNCKLLICITHWLFYKKKKQKQEHTNSIKVIIYTITLLIPAKTKLLAEILKKMV